MTPHWRRQVISYPPVADFAPLRTRAKPREGSEKEKFRTRFAGEKARILGIALRGLLPCSGIERLRTGTAVRTIPLLTRRSAVPDFSQ